MGKSPSYTDDYYSKKAIKEGIRARSYYKLEEIDKKFKIFSKMGEKDWILDLGCSPGSWSQYCLRNSKAGVVGIDLKETQPFPQFGGKSHFLQGNIEEIQENHLLPIIQHRKFSAIISDMAPDTSGDPDRDSFLSYELVLLSWNLAKNCLVQGTGKGFFISKYFQGSESRELLDLLRMEAKNLTQKFGIFETGQVKSYKPLSSRKNSREIYLIVK